MIYLGARGKPQDLFIFRLDPKLYVQRLAAQEPFDGVCTKT